MAHFAVLRRDGLDRMNFVTEKLKDDASLWWRYSHFLFHARPDANWVTLRCVFLLRWQVVNPERLAREDLHTCVQTGSIHSYTRAFTKIVSKVPGIQDDELLDRCIRGCNPNIRFELERAYSKKKDKG